MLLIPSHECIDIPVTSTSQKPYTNKCKLGTQRWPSVLPRMSGQHARSITPTDFQYGIGVTDTPHHWLNVIAILGHRRRKPVNHSKRDTKGGSQNRQSKPSGGWRNPPSEFQSHRRSNVSHRVRIVERTMSTWEGDSWRGGGDAQTHPPNQQSKSNRGFKCREGEEICTTQFFFCMKFFFLKNAVKFCFEFCSGRLGSSAVGGAPPP